MADELKKVESRLSETKVGHIGGNDFILLYIGEEKETFVEEIKEVIQNFYQKRGALFDAESRACETDIIRLGTEEGVRRKFLC